MASVSSAQAKKPDTTRIVMWSVVGLALIAALWVYLAPTPPSKTTRAKHSGQSTTTVASADQNAITPQDLTAHFARYTSGKRDPFIPLVASSASTANSQANQGEWLLTGISSINGVPSALVENSTTGESAFLTDGESWRGLKVRSISSDSIVFENTLGQETHLGFSDESPSTTPIPATAGAPSSNLPTASQVRPLPTVGSLPPLPVPTNAAQTNAAQVPAPTATAPAPAQDSAASQESPVQQQ